MKKLLVLALAIGLVNSVSAQKFFKRLPKQYSLDVNTIGDSSFILPMRLRASVIGTTTTMQAIRPVVIAAAYQVPGNILMAGTGAAYEKLTYNDSTQVWNVNWSVGVYGFAGGSVVPSTPSAIMNIGIGVGILNNNIIFGPCYNFNGTFGGFISIGINFNN